MSDTYELMSAKFGGSKDNPHGGLLYRYYCSFKDSQGTVTNDVFWQKKQEGVNEGSLIYGDITPGEYGPRFKTAQRPTGSPSNGSQGFSGQDTPGPEFWAQKDRRIARAGIVQAVVGSGVGIEAMVNDTDTYVEMVDRISDALLARLDANTPHPNGSADGGGGETSTVESRLTTGERTQPAGPPAAVSASKGFASDKQRDFLSSLLKDAGADSEAQQVVISYAESELSGERDGPISKAIDGLRGENRAEWLVRIVSAAEKWSAEQPNTPAPDTRDLAPTGGGFGVGPDSDDIPFAPSLI